MGNRSSSRYVDVLDELGFCISDNGPLPQAMRKALPMIPDKPVFLLIVDEEEDECTAIVMDETGVCWVGNGDVSLGAQGFINFRDAREKASN
ncbi:MAG TPA: hypothetical protein VJI70_01985 [Candidatus Paceibacterota bacterium]